MGNQWVGQCGEGKGGLPSDPHWWDTKEREKSDTQGGLTNPQKGKKSHERHKNVTMFTSLSQWSAQVENEWHLYQRLTNLRNEQM